MFLHITTLGNFCKEYIIIPGDIYMVLPYMIDCILIRQIHARFKIRPEGSVVKVSVKNLKASILASLIFSLM